MFRRARVAMIGIVLCLVERGTLIASAPLSRACSAAPLPAPTGNVVPVSSESMLQSAIGSLASGTTILIEPGTYRLTATLQVARGVHDVTIRGSTDSCDDVTIVGNGMTNASYGGVPHGIWVGNAQRVLIANLTIRDPYYHCIQFDPGAGAQGPHVYNVHMIDAGEQFIKSSSDPDGTGVSDGIVEYCTMEYTTTARSFYTNGVDVHMGSNWIIRHNLFRNMRAPAGERAGPAILMWNRTKDSIVDGNLFLECQYGIAFGLDASRADDHTGGIVRNNIFYRSSLEQGGDTGITINNCAGTKVLNNTVILNGTYPNAIEFRFAPTKNVDIRYNLCDAAVTSRDGATGTVSDNVTNAKASWFVGAAAGDLHLLSSATAAIDKAKPHPDVTTDYDGEMRSAGSAPDLGADEQGSSSPGPDAVAPAPPVNLRVVK